MKMPKIFVRKVIIGAVLIALSAVITMMIKEALDTQNPESSLPILTVTCNGTPLTTEANNGAPANNEPVSLLRAGYEWSFFTTIERRTPPVTAEDLPLTPTTISAGVPISLTFSRDPAKVQVWRAEGQHGQDFLELSSGDPCNFSAPTVAGTYIYRVRAEWTGRGYIQYFFCITVQ